MQMWYPIVKHLIGHLKGLPALETFNIGAAGIEENIDKPSKIEIEWNTESALKAGMTGQIVLYIDINVRNDDTDIMSAYEKQYEAQKAILNSLKEWTQKVVKELRTAVKVDVPGIAAYGKTIRPTYLARIVLDLEWRKSV